jgi:hypothetical protein
MLIDAIYQKKIEELASEGKNEVFYNSSEAHATAVLTSMVRHSHNEIKILCGSMCSEVSNDQEYMKELALFLDRNGKLKIILAKYNEQDNFRQKPIYKLLKPYIDGQVIIKKIDSTISYKGSPAHFTVADNKAFRLEIDIEKRIAFGNFNDPKSVQSLSDMFNNVFENAKPLSFCLYCF